MYFNRDVNFDGVFIISSKFYNMDTKEVISRLQELIGLHKLSMNHNLNAAIRANNPIYKKFYEQTAYEKMDLMNQLYWTIESISVVRFNIPIEVKMHSWDFTLKEDNQENLKSYIDTHEEALYFCYNLLAEDLLFSVSKTLNEQVHQLETTLVTYGYLKRHV